MNLFNYLKPLLFQLDPEQAHDLVFQAARVMNYPGLSKALESVLRCQHENLQSELAGLQFSNPVGLAAGFDKNCKALGLWRALGFGHVELGTVTILPQIGNPKPRIFRLPEDQAIVNRMGFPGAGARVVELKLKRAQQQFSSPKMKIGVNIGKGKDTPLEKAGDDYIELLKVFEPYADFITVNISSPNTPGLRELQKRQYIEELLSSLVKVKKKELPLFVKLAPDLSDAELAVSVDAAVGAKVSGIVATNTTITRRGLARPCFERGGLSGAPLRSRALEVVTQIAKGPLPVIGVGGIMNAADAVGMLCAGASLVQVYTGLVYAGPLLVRRINTELSRWLTHERIVCVKELSKLGTEGHRAFCEWSKSGP
jgi:dihydroorotate dehydrogenase